MSHHVCMRVHRLLHVPYRLIQRAAPRRSPPTRNPALLHTPPVPLALSSPSLLTNPGNEARRAASEPRREKRRARGQEAAGSRSSRASIGWGGGRGGESVGARRGAALGRGAIAGRCQTLASSFWVACSTKLLISCEKALPGVGGGCPARLGFRV